MTTVTFRMEQGLAYLDFSAAQTPEAVLLNVGDTIVYTFVTESAQFPTGGIVTATDFRYAG